MNGLVNPSPRSWSRPGESPGAGSSRRHLIVVSGVIR
jgi:hypothetical protein